MLQGLPTLPLLGWGLPQAQVQEPWLPHGSTGKGPQGTAKGKGTVLGF